MPVSCPYHYAHIQVPVYAIAEKAADIIVREQKTIQDPVASQRRMRQQPF
jgi:hypothetical protein